MDVFFTHLNATHTGILTSLRSTPTHVKSFAAKRTLPYQSPCGDSIASVIGLSPVGLSAQNHSTSELLRTPWMMAASKSTSWLSLQLHFLSHLAYLRDLS